MTAGKNYQRIYLTTFVFIAVLITASVIIIDYIAAEEERMVEVTDIGGRQRMLSERTVHLLLEYAMENNQEARDQIVKLMELSLQKFDQAHQQLIRGRLSDGEVVIFSDSIDKIFFDEPEYLDLKARIFIYNTREVLDREWSPDLISSYYLKQLREATKQDLHSSLDVLATQYTTNSKSRITRLRVIVAILLGGIVVVLCGVGVLVFNPMFKRIDYAIQKAEKLRKRISDHIVSSKSATIKFSISVGAATVEDSDTSVDDTMKRADKNLYKAKRTGRNLVIAA